MLQPKRQTNYEDLTGMIFGRWKVPEQGEYIYIGTKGAIGRTWLCECQCEKKTIKQIAEQSLKSGTSKSCGCYLKDKLKEIGKRNRKLNHYDLSREYGVGYTSNTNEPFYFDLEDYDKIKEYTWFKDHSKGKGGQYIVSSLWEGRKYLYLHKFVMNTNNKVDHIDRNKLNCRKSNLRFCTSQENAMNTSLKSTNSSGVSGVSWRKDKEKWRAYITKDGKQISLGHFSTKEEAIKARLKGEVEYFGEFAPQKHLFEQYGIELEESNE